MSINLVKTNIGYNSGKYYYDMIINELNLDEGSISAIYLTNSDNTLSLSYKIYRGKTTIELDDGNVSYVLSSIESGIFLNDELIYDETENYKTNDRLSVAMDLDNKKVIFYKNNILVYTANISDFTDSIYIGMTCDKYNTIDAIYNFGVHRPFATEDYIIEELINSGYVPYDYLNAWAEIKEYFIKTNIGYETGKYYYEITVEDVNLTETGTVSAACLINNNNLLSYNTSNDISGIYLNNTLLYETDGYEVDDILGIAIDLDNKLVEFYKNQISLYVADIETFDGTTYIGSKSDDASDVDLIYNFGTDEFNMTTNTTLWGDLLESNYLPYDYNNSP